MGILFMAGAAWFNLTPFAWSYVILVPAVALLLGRFVQWVAAMFQEWDTPAYFFQDATPWFLFAALLFLSFIFVWPQVVSLQNMATRLSAEEPPYAPKPMVAPTGSAEIVLRAAGEWLNANSPPDATVAADRVGIIGYFADREMIDLMGRLQPEVAQALQRRGLFYAVPHLLPDYVVLDEDLVILDIGLRGDPWFGAHYELARRFTSDRLEFRSGKPVFVLQRVLDPPPMIEREKKLDLLPYGGLTVVGYAVDRERLKPGDWMRVRLNLLVSRINDSYATWMIDDPVLIITTYLTNADGEVVTARANSDVLSTFHTEHWVEDGISPIYTAVHVPQGLSPGAYELWVRVEEKGREFATRRLTALTVINDR